MVMYIIDVHEKCATFWPPYMYKHSMYKQRRILITVGLKIEIREIHEIHQNLRNPVFILI